MGGRTSNMSVLCGLTDILPNSHVLPQVELSSEADYMAEPGETEMSIAIQEYINYSATIPYYLNLTLTALPAHPQRPPGTHALSALYPAADGVFRGSVNLTYVLQHLREEEDEDVLGGLEYSNPEYCNNNGIPVLQRRGQR